MNHRKRFLMGSHIEISLTKEQFNDLVDRAIDWALLNGVCMRPKTDFKPYMLQHVSFVLFPSYFPKKVFEMVCELQTSVNTLMHRVAYDYEFLRETLKPTTLVDNFTKKLFDIYETVYKEGLIQDISLGLLRSDLMLNKDSQADYCCKQVEINTIASGCGWLGPATRELHEYILQELGYSTDIKNLPINSALQEICSGMLEAWKIYGNFKAAILFVVEDVTYNICDQRFHEFEIRRQNINVTVIRKSLTQLSSVARLNDKKELIVDDFVISVVYYRSGYDPIQYPTEKEWDVRLLIERSKAIKSPSIQYHLAGTKKIQQALAKPGVLVRFLKDDKAIKQIEKTFVGLYALDFDEEGELAIDMAIANPEKFVLKPQREGGSNNKYGNEIKDFLTLNRNSQERTAWILMDKIFPPVENNYRIVPGRQEIKLEQLVSELGIFGVILGNKNEIFVNKQAGHLHRTKLETANEGGVSSGDALQDVIHAVINPLEGNEESREIFFFREGAVVMWNLSDRESRNIIDMLKFYEENSYNSDLIDAESESMNYCYDDSGKKSYLKNGDIILSNTDSTLSKYTFSNAMAQSVKLGIWEASLLHYVNSIEFITEDLKLGRKIRLTRQEVLRKQGELFALRHLINLRSDLLDTPDIYWERDDLEQLYQTTCGYFSIAKRTRVMNEKLNHCLELIELLSTHLSDRHHIRLEWMIILLIMVEVGFELLHYIDRYLAKND
ncbi:glutathione synthetase-like [Prorops nasuta]|uniref:glutathione synthetase-like n=1 Tax=Prorops nasuta TaxID=863751 RepID=UPI0034CF489D